MKAPINPEADVNPPPPDGNPGDEIEDPGATDKPESMDRDSSEDSQTWEATQISLTPAAYRQHVQGEHAPLERCDAGNAEPIAIGLTRGDARLDAPEEKDPDPPRGYDDDSEPEYGPDADNTGAQNLWKGRQIENMKDPQKETRKTPWNRR